MHPLFTHPFVLTVWAANIAATAVFAWMAVSNAMTHRASPSPQGLTYTLFAALGALHTGLTVVILLPLAPDLERLLFQALWVAGFGGMYLWIHSVKAFVGLTSRILDRLSVPLLIVAALSLFDMLWVIAGGQSLFFSDEIRDTRSILLLAAGEVYAHRPVADLIAAGTMLCVLLSSVILLVQIRRHRPGERVLQVGVALTVVLAIVQTLTASSNAVFHVPLLSFANLLEAMRITWASSLRIGQEFSELRQVEASQRALIDHQLAQRAIRERLVRVGEQTARISHDLRNPLTAVVSGLELIDEMVAQGRPRSEVHEVLGLTRSATGQVLHLVRRITRQALPEGALRPLQLSGIVEDALLLCRHHLDGVQVQVDVSEALWVPGRSSELTQVLVNLLDNGARATAGLPQRWLKITAERCPGRVRLRVADAGRTPGPEVTGRMFRSRFTTYGHAGGTGLGLEICARIVAGHRGTIWVDPDAAHTTFVVELPEASAASEPVATSTPAGA